MSSGLRGDAPCNPAIPPPTEASWVDNVLRVGKTILKTFVLLTGAPTLDAFVESLERKYITKDITEKEGLKEYCGYLMKLTEELMKKDGSNTSQKFKDNLEKFHKALSEISQEIQASNENTTASMERIYLCVTQAMHSFMLVNYISGTVKMEGAVVTVEKHVLHQCIQSLPHVHAAYDDYGSKKKSGPCFEGTREALLEEVAAWIPVLGSLQIYLLSGIAGIGKSTIAYTIAERANQIGYLGASFFFSRDEAERSNAKRFFTTIAFQLCLYDKEFAAAIEKALLTERGLAAIGKDPIVQMEALILKPLRDIVKSRSSPIVTVIDALDECDEEDAPIVLAALTRLIRDLPCFKVILTTRPQPHLPPVPDAHKIFHLHDIEEKVVDRDIRLYLEHNLSLENVSKVFPKQRKKWGASRQDIDALVQVAGRLFIIASTTIRFILSPRIGDPRHRMKYLRDEIDNKQLLFNDLDDFYIIILRAIISESPDKDTKQRYQDIIGTIIVIQEPLPISALENMAGSWSADAIETLFDGLQSVILVKDDKPRIYHKSFADFVTSCNDNDLRIVPKGHHTRLATCCFEIMNSLLRRNLLDLGTPARFMDNDAGLEKEKISAVQLQEKIPGELRYACTYWANHIEGADTEDDHLLREVDRFIKELLLHWLEALSWIRKLDIATDALRVILGSMSVSPDVHGIISDALLFIPKFYKCIHRSALHAYQSALYFTPTESLLFRHYSNEMSDRLCWLEGVPARWDPLIAQIGMRGIAQFSNDNSKFSIKNKGEMQLLKAENGTLIRTSEGDTFSVANDFSVVARLDYMSKKHVEFVFSRESRHIASVMKEDKRYSLTLWSGEKGHLIDVAENVNGDKLAISEDGSLVATGGRNSAQLWSRWGGNALSLLDILQLEVREVTLSVAISHDLLAVGSFGTLRLYDVNNRTFLTSLQQIYPRTLAFSPDCTRLAIGTDNHTHLLYDIASLKAFVPASSIRVERSVKSLSFSPDSTRLASGFDDGTVQLWDTGRTEQPIATHRQHPLKVLMLAFSLDGSQFASASGGGVELWDGRDGEAIHQIDEHLFTNSVTSVAFSTSLLAVGTWADITLFERQSLRVCGTLNKTATSLSFSADGSSLASAYDNGVTVWNVDSRAAIAEFQVDPSISRVMFSPDGLQLAVLSPPWDSGGFKLCDMVNNRVTEPTGHEDLRWIPNFLGGVLISWRRHRDHGHHLVGQFPGHRDRVPVLWIPREFDVQSFAIGSSVMALGCKGGRMLFVRF